MRDASSQLTPVTTPQRNMTKMQVDYSVYLVTDNTPAILGDKDIIEVVRAAVEGGSTCYTVHIYISLRLSLTD